MLPAVRQVDHRKTLRTVKDEISEQFRIKLKEERATCHVYGPCNVPTFQIVNCGMLGCAKTVARKGDTRNT